MAGVLAEAAARAGRRYLDGLTARPVAPTSAALGNLVHFAQPLQDHPLDATRVLDELDDIGSPATVATAGGRFFGFVLAWTPGRRDRRRLDRLWRRQWRPTSWRPPGIRTPSCRWHLQLAPSSRWSVGVGSCRFVLYAPAGDPRGQRGTPFGAPGGVRAASCVLAARCILSVRQGACLSKLSSCEKLDTSSRAKPRSPPGNFVVLQWTPSA